MEGLPRYRLSLGLALAILATALTAAPAWAESHLEPPVDVWVDTGPDEIVVEAETGQSNPGGGGGGSGGSGSGPTCYLREIPGSEWTEDLTLDYWRFRMLKAPYYLICDGEIRGIVWIEIDLGEDGGGAPPSIDPRDVAMRLREEIPVPRATVQINPDRGVVGVESWFWIDGYDGGPITDSTDAFGSLVEVEARVTRYEWSLGDGTELSSDTPGSAYPEPSEVHHVYERSSAGMPHGYPVDVVFAFEVRYRVNGGGWISLPGITREARADYPVRESQAVIGE